MDEFNIRERIKELEEQLAELEANRPAHSPSFSLEMRIDEIRATISFLKQKDR
ncbi:MAG: hypothetical protein QW083_04045 [Methanomassiliicoccales archaeon]